MPFIAMVLVIAAALGGGAVALSQHALPNDALWGFKVVVTENLQGILAGSAQARADWNIAMVQTRLAEAQTLAAMDGLSAGAQARIQKNIDMHVRGVRDAVLALEAGGSKEAAGAARRLQAALAGGVEVLANTPLAAAVRAQLDSASAISAQVGTQ